MRRKWGVLLLLVLFCGACQRNRIVCYNYQHTPTEGWEHHQALSFSVDTVKDPGNYQFNLSLRTTDAYPFQSVWLLVKQHLQNPDTMCQDTIECVLTDRQGNQQGKGLSFYQNTFPLKTLYLKRGQYGTLTVSHIMRRNILPGISDVGVELKQ